MLRAFTLKPTWSSILTSISIAKPSQPCSIVAPLREGSTPMLFQHMSFRNWIPVAALSLMLASCFVSATPLFTAKDADYPIANGERFRMQTLKPDGNPENAEPTYVTITRDGADYIYTEKGEEPLKGMLDDLGNGAYAAITQGETGLLYAVFEKVGNNWLRHGLVCSDFEKVILAEGKTLTDFGITKKDSDCSFSNYDDLKRALVFEIAHGYPDVEYQPIK